MTVRMTEPVGGKLPTGLAATLLAGWQHSPDTSFAHLRVTVQGIVVHNALKARGSRRLDPARLEAGYASADHR